MDNRFKLIENEVYGDTLHLGSNNSDAWGNLQETLNKNNKVYSCDICGTPDYKIDLNDLIWNIDKKFDTVVAGEIIEHVRDPINFLNNCYALLKDNGKIILTTPNATSLSYLVNPSWCVGTKEELWHIHCFTSAMIKVMAERTGFIDIQIQYINSYSKNPISICVGWLIPRLKGGLIMIARKPKGLNTSKVIY